MKLYPNCKINIGLRVLRKRADGYHDIETIFYPIHGIHDELEIEPAETLRFEQSGIVVDCAANDNLILRCYRRMREQYPQIGNVQIRFKKLIPFGAGLGGGSSDAAHVAIALNEIFGLGLSREELAEVVRPLGADCPFFVYNVPCFAEGIGERLKPIEYSLSGKRIVVIKPDVAVSTKEAYSGIQPYEGPFDERVNDFEKTVFKVHPELGEIKQKLLDAGAYYAAMSGSGSTLFGLFEDDAEGRTAAGLRLLEQEFAGMILLNDTLS